LPAKENMTCLELLSKRAKRVVIVACGTSWHAGLIGKYLFEQFARIPVEVEYASEFRYRNPVIFEDDVVMAISQSGETADTLEALRLAKKAGATIFGVVNVVGSTIARETDAGIYLHAGPEIGVASTKAFTAQVTVVTMLVLAVANEIGRLSEEELQSLLKAVYNVPELIESYVKSIDAPIKRLSKLVKLSQNFLFLGRGVCFPVALEGALKLKEISYIHAEGYPAAEMKHGPIALIDRQMPVLVIALSSDPCYEKIKANVHEVMARNGEIIVLTDEGNTDFAKTVDADNLIFVPSCHNLVLPLVSVVPLQLLSYHVAALRGCEIDQPRNLAKSVTVE
jgi:glucosamine--fructose-6-phosphate aminotransferase (isomerizing)